MAGASVRSIIAPWTLSSRTTSAPGGEEGHEDSCRLRNRLRLPAADVDDPHLGCPSDPKAQPAHTRPDVDSSRCPDHGILRWVRQYLPCDPFAGRPTDNFRRLPY